MKKKKVILSPPKNRQKREVGEMEIRIEKLDKEILYRNSPLSFNIHTKRKNSAGGNTQNVIGLTYKEARSLSRRLREALKKTKNKKNKRGR